MAVMQSYEAAIDEGCKFYQTPFMLFLQKLESRIGFVTMTEVRFSIT